MQFIVRYYERYPLDLRDRWEIHRMTVTSETKEKAEQDASSPEIEIIDVEKIPSLSSWFIRNLTSIPLEISHENK